MPRKRSRLDKASSDMGAGKPKVYTGAERVPAKRGAVSVAPTRRNQAGEAHPRDAQGTKRSKRLITSTRASNLEDDIEDDFVCSVCGSGHDEDLLLLCDGCNGARHTYCCSPPLLQVPEGDFICPDCNSDQQWNAAPSALAPCERSDKHARMRSNASETRAPAIAAAAAGQGFSYSKQVTGDSDAGERVPQRPAVSSMMISGDSRRSPSPHMRLASAELSQAEPMPGAHLREADAAVEAISLGTASDSRLTLAEIGAPPASFPSPHRRAPADTLREYVEKSSDSESAASQLVAIQSAPTESEGKLRHDSFASAQVVRQTTVVSAKGASPSTGGCEGFPGHALPAQSESTGLTQTPVHADLHSTASSNASELETGAIEAEHIAPCGSALGATARAGGQVPAATGPAAELALQAPSTLSKRPSMQMPLAHAGSMVAVGDAPEHQTYERHAVDLDSVATETLLKDTGALVCVENSSISSNSAVQLDSSVDATQVSSKPDSAAMSVEGVRLRDSLGRESDGAAASLGQASDAASQPETASRLVRSVPSSAAGRPARRIMPRVGEAFQVPEAAIPADFPDGEQRGYATDSERIASLEALRKQIQRHIETYLEKPGSVYWYAGKIPEAQLRTYLEKCSSFIEKRWGLPATAEQEFVLHCILHENNYDVDAAYVVVTETERLAPQAVDPTCWTSEDRSLFARGIFEYGKQFSLIQRYLLPHRRVQDLVRYYFRKYKQLVEQQMNSAQMEFGYLYDTGEEPVPHARPFPSCVFVNMLRMQARTAGDGFPFPGWFRQHLVAVREIRRLRTVEALGRSFTAR